MAIIKRVGLMGALAAVMMLVLAACGTASTTGPATGSDAGQAAETAEPTSTVAAPAPTNTVMQPEPTATTEDDMGDMMTAEPDEATPATATSAPVAAEGTVTPAADAGAPAGGSTEIQATLREWAIDLSVQEVAAGNITFVVTNQGQFAHNLTVTDASGTLAKTPNFRSNQGPQTLEVELEPGTYTLICDLPGHAAQGQRIELVVR